MTYLPSLQVRLSLQQRRYRESGDSVQQFSSVWNSNLSLLSVETPESDELLSLAFAETASAMVSQLFRHSTRLGTDSVTQAAVENALRENHQIFHFTGHGAYDSWQPQNSMLALAGNVYVFLTTEAKIIQQDHSKMNSREPPFQSPYFWAAFTVTGRISDETEVY